MKNKFLKTMFTSVKMAFKTPTVTEKNYTNNAYVYNAELIRVKDGDTMDVTIDLGLGLYLSNTIRIINFDSAETWRPKNDAELKHGKEATELATKLLSEPFQIRLYDRGSFGRILCDIILSDGSDYATFMIEQGMEKRETYGEEE